MDGDWDYKLFKFHGYLLLEFLFIIPKRCSFEYTACYEDVLVSRENLTFWSKFHIFKISHFGENLKFIVRYLAKRTVFMKIYLWDFQNVRLSTENVRFSWKFIILVKILQKCETWYCDRWGGTHVARRKEILKTSDG